MTFHLVAVGLAGGLGLSPLTARANFEVSAGLSIHATADFYAPLGEQGDWISVGSYGRCWRPAHVAIEWRPYCWGHWVWTDCGWYWESDEPWAWACYHYGCWVYDPVYFWVWVPGIEWAPAWVEWRVGGGCIGWAPLPPRGVSVTLGAPQFVFIQSSRFADPVRPTTVIVNNTPVFNQTTVINNVKQETRRIGSAGVQKVFVNEGPGLETVQVATGRRVSSMAIQEAARQTTVPKSISHPTDQLRGRQTPNAWPAQPIMPAPERKAAPAENRGQPTQEPPERKEREAKPPNGPVTPPEHPAPPRSRQVPPEPAAPPHTRPANPPEQATPPQRRPAPQPDQAAPSRPRETPPDKGKRENGNGDHDGQEHGKDKPGE